MFKQLLLVAIVGSTVVGCASVPMESTEKNAAAKKFIAPANGNAGLYVYRSGSFGGALKKDVWVNGGCVGETAPNVFFFQELAGGAEHKVSTESEFSPNDLIIKMEPGKNYFVEQFIKMGVFVGGAGVKAVSEEEGKKEVAKLNMAKPGKCSK